MNADVLNTDAYVQFHVELKVLISSATCYE